MIEWLKTLCKHGWRDEGFISDMGDDSSTESGEDTCDERSQDSSSSAAEVHSQVFKKKFKPEQVDIWVRLRTEPTRFQGNTFVDVYTTDDSVVKGDIDVMQDSRGYSRRFCTWVNALWAMDHYAKSLRCNEFFHEAVLSYAVKSALADIPVFARAALREINVSKRTLVFQNTQGKDLDSRVMRMTLSELKSAIAQVLVALRIAQHRISLKHHDLHLGNVMVTPRTCPGTWVVQTPEGLLNIPLDGYDATIIDFGLSSIVKDGNALVRLDIDLLIAGNSAATSQASRASSEIGKSWGAWDPELSNDTGYDYTMFVESITETVLRIRPMQMDKIALVYALQKLITTPLTDRCRPVHQSMIDWPGVWHALELK
jgi:hypothetical protein